jgi:hypothetical protein
MLSPALEATAVGFAPVRVPFHGVVLDTDERVEILLVRGATLRGRVVAKESGAPIGGARVFLWSETEVGNLTRFDGRVVTNPEWASALGETRTGADGGFRFDHVPAWTGWPVGIYESTAWSRRLGHVAASAEGRVVATSAVAVPEDGQEVAVLLELDRGGSVRGRVVDENGAAFQGASVSWRWLDQSRTGWIHGAFQDAPLTWIPAGVAGEYLLTGVPTAANGSARVEVVATPPGSWLGRAAVPVAVAADGVTEVPPITISRHPRAPAIDLVVTGEDGRPVAGAFAEHTQSGSTDRRGHLRVRLDPSQLPEGVSMPLSVAATGYEAKVVDVVPSTEAPPTVAVTLALARAEQEPAPSPAPSPHRIRTGSIRDAVSGRPILKFRIRRLWRNGSEGSPARATGPGRFAFDDSAEDPWVLRAEAPGYEALDQNMDASAEFPEPLDLRLVPGLAASVRCRDASGAPLGQGKVWFQGTGSRGEGEIGPDGTVVVRGLRAGVAYEVTCAAAQTGSPARWWVPTPFAPVTASASSEAVPIDLTFTVAGVASIRVSSPRVGGDYPEPSPEQRAARQATKAVLLDAHGGAIWTRSRLVGSGWSVIVPQGRYTLRVEIPDAPRFEREVTLTPDPSTVIEVSIP